MKRANIADLKNRLSHYLRFVRRGESVLVCDRNRVIARLEPVRDEGALADAPDWTDELRRNGTLRAPSGTLSDAWLKQRPRTKADVVAALLADRRSGR